MNTLTILQELSRLKTGAPTTDYDRRDKALDAAKKAVQLCVKHGIPID